MKKSLILPLVVLFSMTFSLYGQFSSRDSLRVSTETHAQAQLLKLSRELNLTTQQQKAVYNFLLSQKTAGIKNEEAPQQELLELLTFQQKSLYLKLLEIDKNAGDNLLSGEVLEKGALTLAGTTQLILDSPAELKDARLALNNHPDGAYSANYNYSTYKRISMMAWTYSGQTMFNRNVMRFVLDEIPAGSQIVSATLYLYSDPTITSPSSSDGNSQLSGTNEFYIERIIEPWDDLTVTWNNQPASTTENRLLIPPSTSVTENIQIDLTGMVQTWVNTPNLNYGIKMFLQTEVRYRARNYGSMEHANTGIRPRLVVEYNNIESSIEYIYDDAGNRTDRQVIVIQNNLKSATLSDDDNKTDEEPIKSNWENMEILIYPNPTIGDINLGFKGSTDINDIRYQVFNATGKLMLTGHLKTGGLNRLQFSTLSKGLYILVLQHGTEKKTWKIIKQ